VLASDWRIKGASAKLAAAQAIREEICGPMPRKSEISGPSGEPIVVEIKSYKRESGEA